MRRERYIISMLLLAVIFMTGLWSIDIGVTGMLNDLSVMTLLGFRTAADQYHLGLLVCLISFFMMAMLSISLVLRKCQESW